MAANGYSVVAYTGLEPQVVEIDENDGAGANDWYEGDLVKCDSDGELVIATSGVILGVARKAATGTDNTNIPVELINFSEIYVMHYSTTTAETIIGDVGTITFTAGGHYVTSTGSAGSADCYIVGLHPGDDVGTDGGRVLVRFAYNVSAGV